MSATSESVDDMVDVWHTTETGVELHEWLGMTWDEYAAWARHPSNLPADWHQRAKGRPLNKGSEQHEHCAPEQS